MQVRKLFQKCGLFVVLIALLAGTDNVSAAEASEQTSTEGKPSLQITEKIYSNIFVRKREEHKLLVKHLLSTEDYSKRFELLKLAYKEIIRVVQEDGAKLRENGITTGSEFPKQTESVESLARYLENTCFFAELILHHPDISYRIIKSFEGWREQMIQAQVYTRSFVNILDQKSLELLGLLEQEIDEQKRTDSYVNPYKDMEQSSSSNHKSSNKPTKKKKPSIKRGPQLSGAPKTEL